MDDALLLKIALIVGVIGVIGLFLLNASIDLKETRFEDVDSVDSGYVKISGVVERVYSKENLTIIDVSQKCNIKVVVFDEVELSEGQYIEAEGTVEDYEGKNELLAERIVVK